MMNPSPPHQYPEAIQLKLYQAFIFSIPILFSIILFLLFYLFYLKRRAAAASSSSPILPRTAADASTGLQPDCDSDLKTNEVKNKLCEILFDDSTEARDSLCCVCLGEFEMKEELLQVRACKHMFHVDCIRHWLHNHSTCPLCRAPVVSSNSKPPHRLPPPMQVAPPYNTTTTITDGTSTSQAVAPAGAWPVPDH